jgi:hypothetical protein
MDEALVVICEGTREGSSDAHQVLCMPSYAKALKCSRDRGWDSFRDVAFLWLRHSRGHRVARCAERSFHMKVYRCRSHVFLVYMTIK